MALALSDFRQQTQQAWLNLSRTQSLALIASGLALAVVLAVVTVWARTPTYRIAYSGLAEQDASAIVASLKERDISYQLEAGGTRILVPDQVVEDVRLQIAGGQLPSGGSGFELFDKAQFGLTDYAQRINYQRALEGELSRTIGRLSSVEQARVHLVLGTPSLYLDQEKPASASIMLKLRPGQRLTEGQVRGVAYLVSGSVSGLKPENLRIVDTSGNVLSTSLANADANSGAPNGDQMAMQRDMENRLERDILAMLESVTGPGKASVRVSATMNWDLQETSSEVYTPVGDKPLVRSLKELAEGYDKADGTAASGTPGTAANLPTYQQPATDQASGQGNYNRKESTVNYELSKTVAKVVKAPGSVERLTVAVALDRNAPVTVEYTDQIRELVTAAAGLNTSRGDSLTVTAVPFEPRDLVSDQQALDAQRQDDLIREGLRTAGMIISPLLLLVVLFILLRRFRSVPLGGLSATSSVYSGAPAGAVGAPEAAPSLSPAMARRAYGASNSLSGDALADLTQMAKTQPQLVVQAINTWLEDEQRRREP